MRTHRRRYQDLDTSDSLAAPTPEVSAGNVGDAAVTADLIDDLTGPAPIDPNPAEHSALGRTG